MFVTLTAPSFGLVHTRPLDPDGRAAALPAAPRRAGLPARRAAVVRRGARRRRSVPRRAAVPGVLRPRGRAGVEQHARRAVAAHDDLPAAHARAPDRADAGAAARARARLVRQGRRVPAPRPRAPARADPAGSRDARVPRATSCTRRRGASTVELLERRRPRRPSTTSTRRSRDELGGGRVRWGTELDVRQLDAGTSARRGRRLPRQVRDQEHRAGRRRAAPRRPSTRSTRCPSASTCAPTCARRSSSPPTPRSPTGASARARTRSATAATA